MKVYVIHGSPLSGKSTYVNKHKGDNDIIYDFDLIMSAISGKEVHERTNHLIEYVTDIQSLIIAKLKSEENIDTAWIITTNVTSDLKRALVGLNPIYKEVKTTRTTAKKRLRDNPGNRNIEEWDKAIDRYFKAKEDYSKFYNTVAWKNKRKVILKRDNYKCKQCSRYGKAVDADTVHHIQPIEDRPDLRLTNDNLLSLCESCHEKMHNKYTGELSKLGIEWRERTLRRHTHLRHTESV